MSFLNPVNEPVLRFKSTDASAPQINYNARTAGDVKAVLKACLVTGYGAIDSAGWTAANEVDNVIEFVSPSAARSEYRLGIDDSTATKTDWYYQYQDARTNPAYNNPTKTFTNADKTSGENGWQMLVTERGIVFIELVQHSAVSKLSARITYWGAVKSALTDSAGKNICFFNIGHNAATANPFYFYNSAAYVHTQLATHTSSFTSAATSNMLSTNNYTLDATNVDLVSPIYLADGARVLMLGELPPMLSKFASKTVDLYGVSEQTLDTRNALSVCAGQATSNASTAHTQGRTFLIKTDYWEY